MPDPNTIPTWEETTDVSQAIPKWEETVDVKKKGESIVGSKDGGQPLQTQEQDTPLPLGYQRILKTGKIPVNPFEKAALGQDSIDEVQTTPITVTSPKEKKPLREPSVYDQALEDTEKWYGQWPSPRKKISNFNQAASQIKSKYQQHIDQGMPEDQVNANLDIEISQLAKQQGLLWENGEVSVPQAEVDKYEETYKRKLDERLSKIAEDKKNPYIKDVLGNLGSGSAQVLATPYNLLAISEKVGNAILNPLGVDPSTYWQDFSKYLAENQSEMAENSKRYDEDIISLAKNGEVGKAIGSAVLQTAQALPMLSTLIMGNAAGATNSALAFMGTSSAAQEYMSNNDKKDIGEFYKIIDAMGVGLAEVAGESLGTVTILRGIKKGIEERGANIVQQELTDMLRTNMQRNVAMIMRGNSDMVREGVSEGMTQFAQNLMAKATTDPNRNIWEGVTDAAIVGSLIGKGINLSLNAANSVKTAGIKKTIRETVKQVPENYSLDAKEKLIPLIIERDAIKAKIEDATDPIKKMMSPQIKAIDDEITKISAKEEGIELPVEEKPKEGEKKEPEVVIPKSEVTVSSEGITPLNEEKPIEKPKGITLNEKTPISEDDKAILQLKGDNFFTRQINKDGEKFGQITVEETDKTWNVKDVVVDEEKQGYGKEVYRQMNDMAQQEGKAIASGVPTKDTSKKATYMWESLVKSGEATKNEDGSYQMIPKEQIVEPKIKPNAEQIRSDQGQNDKGGSIPPEGEGISGQNLQQSEEAGAKASNEKERLARVENVKAKKLTHIEGLQMGQNQAAGTYFSTENENRYATKEKPAKEVAVTVENPIEFDQQKGEFQDIRTNLLNENKTKFVEGDFLEYKTPTKDKFTVDDLNEPGVEKLAGIVTDHFKAQGYDSIHFIGKGEGELVVFDSKVWKYKAEIDKKSLHDRIVSRLKDYNSIPRSYTKKRSIIFNEVNNLVSKLGYSISQKEGVLSVNKDGKPIKKISVPRTKEGLQSHKSLEEYEDKDFIDFVNKISDSPENIFGFYDTGIAKNKIQQAIQDINDGKKNANTNDLLDYLEDVFDKGEVTFYDAVSKQLIKIPIDDVLRSIDEANNITDQELNNPYTTQEINDMVDDYYNGMVDEVEFGDIHTKLFTDNVFPEEDFESLKNNYNDQQQSRKEEGNDSPEEVSPNIKVEGPVPPKESKAAAETRIKLDAEIIDNEKLSKAAKIRKNEKIAEFHKRNALFGDTKKETEGSTLFNAKTEFSQKTIDNLIATEVGEIRLLEEKIVTLKKNKEAKIKEAVSQKEMFGEPKKEVKEYKYRLLLRPFDIGTYPKEGFIRHESDDSNYGTVVMDRPLSVRDYERFDLLPVTEIESVQGKEFVDSDGYYSKISLKWWNNQRGAEVSMYDTDGNLVSDPFGMSAKEILKNINEAYWTEKPKGPPKMEENAFAQQSKGKKKTPTSKEKGIQKPVNPTGKETKKEPTKRWIDEEQVTNEGLKGIEVPELVKMIVKLSGKYPALKNFQKKLGVFYHSETGDSSIALHRKLFTKDGINMLGRVIAHEFGHFIDFLPEGTLKRGNILGRIASLKEYFSKTLGEKPGKEDTVLTPKDRALLRKEAERSLKEEYDKGIREIIEEVIKEEPIFEESGLTTEDILGIWNDNHARENNPELYEYIAKLSSYQKKRIVIDALKGLIDTEVLKRFSKGKQIGVKLTKELIKKTVTPKPIDSISIRDKYRELLREEINKRRLFEAEVIREELEALTKWWNPYDEGADATYTEYRKSGKELYAEALSVLLNNPQTIAERALFFNRAFFNYFPNKPNVKQVYDEIQDLISKPKEVLQQDRLNRVYDGFKRAESKRQEIAKQEKMPKLSGWNKLLKDYVSLIIPIIRKIPEPRKLTMELNDRQVLRDYLEKLAFANEKVAVMLVDMEKNINKELERSGLSVEDFSALLEVERNISQRTDIANPYAFQQIASSELKAFIESKFTGEQKETMDRVKQTFHNKVFDIMENAYRAGMFTPEQYEYISKFKDSYATFQVVDYIDKNSVAAGFKKATGTLKEVESPYISTLFKVASVIKGIERQNAVSAFIDAYTKYLPGEIAASEHRRINGISTGFKDGKNKGRIEYYKDGKWSGLDVDPYIAEFFEMNKPSDLGQLITIFHYFNKGFKPLVTTWNVGWAFFSNIFRDHPRTFYNTFAILASTEGMSKVDALKLPATYFKSLISIMPDAKKFVQGELTPLIEDMINEGVLRHGFFGSYDPHAEESIGPVFQAAGMIRKDQSVRDKIAERSKILKVGLKILGGIEFAGQILEVSSKMTAFNLLQQNLGNAKAAGFYTRNYAGTPNYLDKGTHTRTTNEVFTFSNVILQSIRTDSEIAFKPQTRGAYWSAQVISVVTPAALMALAAAGLFGDELEDLYGQLTEYEKTNFLCVIWGKTSEGKPVYTKIPIPEFSRVTHGITYKTMKALLDGEGISKPEQLLALGSSLTPSPSPLIKTGMGWTQYIANKNPYDFFYGSNVLTDRAQEARGWPALKKMITWSVKNMGGGFITKFYDYDPIKNTTTEYILKNIPLVGRVVKIGGYGQSETLSGIGSEVRSEKAKESLKLDKTINEYVIKALSQGKDMTTSGEIMDEMKKEIYGTDKISPEQNREFYYTKKKFKTKLVKGIKSPFSTTVSSIVDSQSNDEKVAKLQEYTLIYGEDKFIELINYLSSQELISDALRSKVKDMVENIDLDEQKRNDIIQALDQYNEIQSGSRIIPQ